MSSEEHVLAHRLGTTVHVSPLRMKLKRLRIQFPSPSAACLEDWLVDVANERGARIVFREDRPADVPVGVPPNRLTDEELIVGICEVQNLDRPQMLRLAAQLISRQAVNLQRLCHSAEQERVGTVLAELARQALKVDKAHATWQAIAKRFAHERPLRDTLLHWTRLAEPVMKNGRCDAQRWELVA
jgi:hypothetical protein